MHKSLFAAALLEAMCCMLTVQATLGCQQCGVHGLCKLNNGQASCVCDCGFTGQLGSSTVLTTSNTVLEIPEDMQPCHHLLAQPTCT